jgi:hypothetical protein
VGGGGIGALWSLWHLPLSFMEGSNYYELGAGSLRFWLTHLMLVQLGVLLVWLANGSGGHELRGRLTGLRSYRVGVYRIIYELRDDRTVRVVAIRHRETDPR